MTELLPFAEALGWGTPGILLCIMGWAYWKERKRNDELNEKRMADFRTQASETLEIVRTLDRAIEIMKERTNV